MSESAIAEAFDAFLSPRVPGAMPVAWDEVPFTPPAGPWIAPRMSARVGRSVGPGADTVKEFAGTYQISVYWPSGSGVYPVNRRAEDVAKLFPRGLTLTTDDGLSVIVTDASLPPALSQPGWVMVPVQISWIAYEVPS